MEEKGAIQSKKKSYESARMEVVYLSSEDVIVTSVDASSGGYDPGWTGYY